MLSFSSDRSSDLSAGRSGEEVEGRDGLQRGQLRHRVRSHGGENWNSLPSPCFSMFRSFKTTRENQAKVPYVPPVLMSGPAGNEWTEVTVTPSLSVDTPSLTSPCSASDSGNRVS